MGYYLAAVVIGGIATINQIESQEFDPGIDLLAASADGQPFNTFIGVNELKQMMKFSTSALALAITNISLTGLDAQDGITLYFQQAAQAAERGNCVKIDVPGVTLVVIDSINGPHNKPATASISCYPVSEDGVTNPVTITTNESLPALVTTREYFTIGPVKYNGTALAETEQIDLTLNNDIDFRSFDGAPYPTRALIKSIKASFSVKSQALDQLQSLGVVVAQGATDSLIYFRKYAPSTGARVANATTSHIKFTLDDGLLTSKKAGGSHGNFMEADWEITPSYDGTNPLIAVSTASAIA